MFVPRRTVEDQATFALVPQWAGPTPMAGLHCSGVAVDRSHIATAAHCLGDSSAAFLLARSLCDAIPPGSPTVDLPASAVPNEEPSGSDAIVVAVPFAVGPEAPIRRGAPSPVQAFVIAFGQAQALGRPGCGATEFDGNLGRCDASVAATWCLSVSGSQQVCGGSSGAPIFARRFWGAELVGLVSGGPECGEEGPIVLAELPPLSPEPRAARRTEQIARGHRTCPRAIDRLAGTRVSGADATP